jgi:hypothetical protein
MPVEKCKRGTSPLLEFLENNQNRRKKEIYRILIPK